MYVTRDGNNRISVLCNSIVMLSKGWILVGRLCTVHEWEARFLIYSGHV